MASSGRSVEDQAWVTLATNDTYALGALVLAHSLIQVGTTRKLVVLATPGVSGPMRSHLGSVFDLVQEVNVLDSSDAENLALLSRPDLGITFTKLHCWRLTQFKRCVFMDADTLVLQNCDELFDREELSAAPDVGWPDCFNTGVFVYQPSNETYHALVQCALTTGSFDGGDQGLLNTFFSDWATKDIAKHLPFIYNMTSSVAYTYLPAYQHFAKDVKVVHFIGPVKPWHHHYNAATETVEPHPAAFHSSSHLQSWWNVFVRDVKPNLKDDLTVETEHVEEQVKQAGLAGYLSQMALGEAQTSEQKSLEDRARQFAWEQGQVDFMGADSFDNIQKKLDASLASTNVTTTTTQTDAAEAEKSMAPSVGETPKEAAIASVVSDQSSVTVSSPVQSSDAPVLTSPIAVSSSAVGAIVSSGLPDSSQIGDVKPPSLTVAIPPAAPIKPIIPTPPIPLPPPPATPPVVPATPPTPSIPTPPPAAAPGTLPVDSAAPGTPPVAPVVTGTPVTVAPGTPPVAPAVAPATPPVAAAAVPGTPPVVPGTPPVVSPVAPATPPVVSPVAPATPPVVSPVAPATPPVVSPVAPATPPVVSPVAPATPPVVSPVAPATPPVVSPVAPATPPVVSPVAPATPPVAPSVAPIIPPVVPVVPSVPSVRKTSGKSPAVPSTPPVAAETPAPPVPPRIPSTPPASAQVPSLPSSGAPQAKVASSAKTVSSDVPAGASPAEVVEPSSPAGAAAAAAEESAPKAAGGKKSAKQTPSAPVRKGEKSKPSKK